MNQDVTLFREKATESLAGAESEFVNRRHNNCANQAYYACFHAAVYALGVAGITSRSGPPTWPHDALQASFVQELILRRKVYPSSLRDTLERGHILRIAGRLSE